MHQNQARLFRLVIRSSLFIPPASPGPQAPETSLDSFMVRSKGSNFQSAKAPLAASLLHEALVVPPVVRVVRVELAGRAVFLQGALAVAF